MTYAITRRAAVAASLVFGLGLAHAQSTTRILVGFPPGGGTDAIARILGERLKEELGHPVIVENKPGAGGQIAAQTLKASAADGNTLFLSHDHSITILPMVMLWSWLRNSVLPSAAEAFRVCAAICPPAPGLFSTMTG
jgi:tripartite-type tricarboxylate transporter receptor subunit TctC